MTVWDVAAICLLGAAGFAFSYDALRQVAVAIHAREQLSYLFPVFVDGFIAYGVRALVLLRNRDFGARLYAWVLFSAATGASLWANALHAITLNHGPLSGPSALRLGDSVVGVLSTLAPLALAGAVHLFILMTRTAESPVRDQAPAATGPVPDSSPTGASADDARRIADSSPAPTDMSAGAADRPLVAEDGPTAGAPEQTAEASDTPSQKRPATTGARPSAASNHQPGTGEMHGGLSSPIAGPAEDGPDTSTDDSSDITGSEGRDTPAPGSLDGLFPDRSGPAGREAVDEELEELLPIAREAVEKAGRISRTVVASAVRDHQAISNERLGELLTILRTKPDEKHSAPKTPVSALW
ncbi:DUF2637 domain-containing protein [Streptomyces monomycini]|uniref:DUF2637 domain-containing protein n=1 Tax=Streptomyces monomycini TaxID=371720 RepID=UPI0004AA5A70|nr:DUF2637 domain-containing protein [Streptomyces monomycini]